MSGHENDTLLAKGPPGKGWRVTRPTLQGKPISSRCLTLAECLHWSAVVREFALQLVKQVFTNEDGSTGILCPVTSDTTLSGDGITTIYQKRWNVEPYHKSLKQNVSLEKSPTQTVTTQTNHFFAALCGYIKLELLKGTTKLNHFALKSKLYMQAIQAAYTTLRMLSPSPGCVRWVKVIWTFARTICACWQKKTPRL